MVSVFVVFVFNRLLSNHLMLMFHTYPGLVVKHREDIMEYISGLKNLGPAKEDFCVHLVCREKGER